MKLNLNLNLNVVPAFYRLLTRLLPRRSVHSLKSRLLVPMVGLMVLSLLGSTVAFLGATAYTRNQLLQREVATEVDRIAGALASRVEQVDTASYLIAQDPSVAEAVQENSEAALSTLNNRAVVVRDRFDLDVVQIYDQDNQARANLMLSSLYGESLLLSETDRGQPRLVSVDDRLLILSRKAMPGGQGIIVIGIDLETELGRIASRYRLVTDIGLQFDDVLVGTQDELPTESRRGGGNYVSVQAVDLAQANADLVLVRPTSSVRRVTTTGLVIVVGSTLLTTLLLIGVGVWLAGEIARPIERLSTAAQEVAEGDLSQVVEVDQSDSPWSIGAGDEIGVLAEAFNRMTSRLRRFVDELEQRVAERTRELEENLFELEGAAQVARQAASIRDVDQLLDEMAHLVSVLFGFYHTGFFLIDEAGEYAILRAASSAGGRRMLERGHRLRVGEQGIVGFVADAGVPRVALDVGEEAVHFENPDLPDTHSEMAAPLEVRGEIIGVLDVQSMEKAAFSDQDVTIIKTMADQIAVAIENARLLETSQRALRELEMAQGKRVRSAWRRKEQLPAYEYDRVDVRPADVGSMPIVDQALASGQVVSTQGADNGGAALAAPLRLRDQAIGAIALEEISEKRSWSQDEVDLVQDVSEQVAQALESARLFEEAQRRAEEQAVLNELGQTLTAQLNVEEVLEESYRGASRLLDTTNFYIALYDHTDVSISFPLAIEKGEPVEWVSRDMEEGAPSGLTEHIIRTREPLLIREDVAQRLETLGIEMIGRPAFSWLGVPLVVGGEVLGVMAVQSYRVDSSHRAQARSRAIAYDEHDRELLTAVASQTAIALESAKLYEEALETAERLREVDRLKSQFLANMSHELRTPLNSIIGFSRVVLKGIDGPVTDRQREDLDAIYNSGQHLLGLINDILDVSKIEAGKMELDFEPVNLREIINGVMSTAIALVKDKPVDLEQSIPDGLPIITADERRVRQILLNLVSNAAKFTDQGFIRVGAEVDGGKVCIFVEDTGKGIAQEEMNKVFQPFTQVDASTTREHGGTGLGLTISHSFVQLHGGRMWVESELGEGSTFYFNLPIEGPPSEAEDAEKESGEEELTLPEGTPEEGSGPLILCVDDDTGVINLYRRYLHVRGYRVFGLTDSNRVVDVAERLDPYAITLDVMMPHKDGWEVIRDLKDNPETSDIPVIICSIVSEQERGISLGAADYLVKPIMEEDLVTALDRLDGDSGSHKVLVVDDHASDRHLLRRMIESQDGYEVVEAAGGEEAIALIEEVRPHIIILDLMMPKVDGFAVLEAIKAKEATRSIPVVVVTAKELSEEEHQLLNHRVETLVHKGVLDQEELLEDVAAALRKLDGQHP